MPRVRVSELSRLAPDESAVVIQLGETYRDKVTGFTGTAVKRMQTLGGADQVALEQLGNDGKPFEVWRNVDNLEPFEGKPPLRPPSAPPGFG